MTTEQKKRVMVALEQTSGKIGAAASLLNIGKEALKRIIRENPEFQAFSPDAQPPSEVETIARPALPVVSKEDEALVEAMEKADAQVKQGFRSIGLDGAAADEAMSFRNFGKHHFTSMHAFVSGGVARLFSNLMQDIQEVRAEIADPANKADMEKQAMLREDRSNLIKHALTTFDRVRQSSLDAAVIAAKRAEMKNGGKKKGQPAFTPLAMQVNGSVTIQEGTKKAEPLATTPAAPV